MYVVSLHTESTDSVIVPTVEQLETRDRVQQQDGSLDCLRNNKARKKKAAIAQYSALHLMLCVTMSIYSRNVWRSTYLVGVTTCLATNNAHICTLCVREATKLSISTININ